MESVNIPRGRNQREPNLHPPRFYDIVFRLRSRLFNRAHSRAVDLDRQAVVPARERKHRNLASRAKKIFNKMSTPWNRRRGQSGAANIPEGNHEVIDLASDSEPDDDNGEDDDLVELRSPPAPQNGPNRSVVLNSPFPAQQNLPEMVPLSGVRPDAVNRAPMIDPEPRVADRAPAQFQEQYGGVEFDEEMFMRDMEDDLHEQSEQAPYHIGIAPELQDHNIRPRPVSDREESLSHCLDTVGNILPGICKIYVTGLYGKVSKLAVPLISYILDQPLPYPREVDQNKVLKRKRAVDEDEEAIRKYSAHDRKVPTLGESHGIRPLMSVIVPL